MLHAHKFEMFRHAQQHNLLMLCCLAAACCELEKTWCMLSTMRSAVQSAAIEASSADQGVGLVKLMGRSSGFIALNVRPSHNLMLFTLCFVHVCILLLPFRT
jgi:hypothetical protein